MIMKQPKVGLWMKKLIKKSKRGEEGDDEQVVTLVHGNGTVEKFYRDLKVKELTIDYPDHFICRAEDLRLGAPPREASEDDSMEVGHTYFLLPKQALDFPLCSSDLVALFGHVSRSHKPNVYHVASPDSPTSGESNLHVILLISSPDFFRGLLSEHRLITQLKPTSTPFLVEPPPSPPTPPPPPPPPKALPLLNSSSFSCSSPFWKPHLFTISEEDEDLLDDMPSQSQDLISSSHSQSQDGLL